MTTAELAEMVPTLLIKRRMGESLTEREQTILAYTADAGNHGQRSFTGAGLVITDFPGTVERIEDLGGTATMVEHEGQVYLD